MSRPGRPAGPADRERQRGQNLVEFSLALIPFLLLFMAVVDLGRGIYTSNGVAQAAREIARVASVHQCAGPCTSATWSAEILEVVNAQRGIVPGLQASDITIECVEIDDTVWTVTTNCLDGKFIRVTTSATFQLVTPLLPIPNPFTVSSTAHVQVP
ncbi:MAG: pilus assembly protein [Chloroflexi bacterium]|nr:pilus assembly protein [Chloroflexota bacterium]